MLTDSISPLESPWSRAAWIAGRWRLILRPSATNAGMRHRLCPSQPAVEGSVALPRPWLEHVSQALFEQIGAVQPGAGLGDPGELVDLVRPVRSSGFFHNAQRDRWIVLRRRATSGSAARPGCRPGRSRAGGRFQTSRRTSSSAWVAQATTWNGSAHNTAWGQRLATTWPIHSAPSPDTWRDLAQRSGTERVEEPAQGGPVAAGRGPHQPPVSWSTTTVRYLWPFR